MYPHHFQIRLDVPTTSIRVVFTLHYIHKLLERDVIIEIIKYTARSGLHKTFNDEVGLVYLAHAYLCRTNLIFTHSMVDELSEVFIELIVVEVRTNSKRFL